MGLQPEKTRVIIIFGHLLTKSQAVDVLAHPNTSHSITICSLLANLKAYSSACSMLVCVGEA